MPDRERPLLPAVVDGGGGVRAGRGVREAKSLGDRGGGPDPAAVPVPVPLPLPALMPDAVPSRMLSAVLFRRSGCGRWGVWCDAGDAAANPRLEGCIVGGEGWW